MCATRSVHLHNSTGLVLAPGKVSVFEEGRISAHAPFPPMLPGDDQLIPIGPDSTVSILRSVEQKQVVKRVELVYSGATQAAAKVCGESPRRPRGGA